MANTLQEAAVSSSSTLWATASKEWVIPAKPKPGRKPKKDTSARPVEDAEHQVEMKARRNQNRAAQRAFRERKQSHLAELQARIQMYEQGDVERNVALQNVAKRLKEDNDALSEENVALRTKLQQMEADLNALRSVEKKRGRTESNHPPRKKSRAMLDGSDATHNSSAMPSPLLSSSTSSISSPDNTGSPYPKFSPLSLQDLSQDGPFNSPLNILETSQGTKHDITFDPDMPFDTFSCGLCTGTTICVCREVVMHQQTTEASPLHNSLTTKLEITTSILDNLPEYQPPVPLRRRTTNRDQARPGFPISNPSSDSSPTCSGDPQNCKACMADDFGKAFCEAVNESAAATACDNCPGGSACALLKGPSSNDPTVRENISPTSPPIISSGTTDMISCDNAWRQLKSHPNVEFSDLTLLADVVARRTKCNGQQVIISPTPGSVTPERTSTHISLPPIQLMCNRDNDKNQVPLYANGKRQQDNSVPQLVPQEVLVRCGREQRIRAVRVDAVQDALRILDAKSTFYKV